MSDLLVRDGRLVTPAGIFRGDLFVSEGTIAVIGTRLAAPDGVRVIEAAGRLVLPGAVDPHVHFGLRVGGTVSCDDFGTGTAAAVAGGVTTVIDYTDPAPAGGLDAAFALRRGEMAGRLHCDAALHGVLTDWTPATRAAVGRLMADGVTSFKVFMVYAQAVDEPTLLAILEASGDLGFLVCTHAESAPLLAHFQARVLPRGRELGIRAHPLTRPPAVEVEAVERACAYAAAVGGRLHLVHLSAAGSVGALTRARAAGADASGETCPQYLTLDAAVFDRPDGHRFATCPQIRDLATDGRALGEALADGRLQCLATDHCAFSLEQKDAWGGDPARVPFGLPGVETARPLLFTRYVKTGRMGLARFVEVTAAAPARRFGLAPRKGSLAPGADGDLAIVDPDRPRTVRSADLHTPCGHSPYEGEELFGFPDFTVVGGRVVCEDGRIVGTPAGRYLSRGPCGRVSPE